MNYFQGHEGKCLSCCRLWSALGIQHRDFSVSRLSDTKPRINKELRAVINCVLLQNGTCSRAHPVGLSQDSYIDLEEMQTLLKDVANLVQTRCPEHYD